MTRKTVQIPDDVLAYVEAHRVVDEEGQRESFSSALVRYLRKAIEVEKVMAGHHET